MTDAGVPVEIPQWNEVEDLQGMRVHLSDGSPATTTTKKTVTAGHTEAMTLAETVALLGRLPEMTKAEEVPFAMREKSSPPPLSGQTVPLVFPPDVEREPAGLSTPKALEVLRFAPEGDVSIAPHLTVTFNQPMIPLSSHAQVAQDIPVNLTPEVEGEWVWLGTQTLQFKPTSRFPMATEYRVVVPQGIVSEQEQVLKESQSFTFRTPAVRLISKYPVSGPQVQRPTIFLGFDQEIDPTEMAKFVQVKSDQKEVSFRLISTDEALAIPAVKPLVQQGIEGRWMVIEPRYDLEKGAQISVTVSKGAPSKEGPIVTPSGQTFGFSVHSELAIKKSVCGWSNSRRCSPTDWWSIHFNNPLNGEAFDPKSVKIEPAIERAHISVSGNSLRIGGQKKGRTTYTVTVPRLIQDTFEQTLGQSEAFTFKVGPANPVLQGPRREFVVLDPSGPRSFPIYTTNRKSVRLRVLKVQPEDRTKLTSVIGKWNYRDAEPPELPGTLLVDKQLKIEIRPDEMVETQIELSSFLTDGLGQLLVWIEAEKPRGPWDENLVWAWVQSTQLAVSAQSDATQLQVWANRLVDGKAAVGAEVELYPNGLKGTVGEDGLVKMDLPVDSGLGQMLIVRQGEDMALLPGNSGLIASRYHAGWKKGSIRTSPRWFVFDDRGLYKPGETAHMKGWVRMVESSPSGDVGAVSTKGRRLKWTAQDNYGNSFAQGESSVSALGGFDFSIELPKTVQLGHASVRINLEGVGRFRHALDIQEFRRPEYEVNAQVDKGPYVLGTKATVSVNAAYFAGGGLANAATNWTVMSSPGSFTPPNWDQFSFGVWRPWWRDWSSSGSTSHIGNLKGKTDALGNHFLEMHVEAMNPPRPMNLFAEASVEDVNRQRWSAKASLLVHPSELYIGMKMARSVVEAKMEFEMQAVSVDLDGKAVEGVQMEITLERMEWKRVKGVWSEVPEVLETCSPKSQAKPVSCSFTPPDGASYRVQGRVVDTLGRPNASSLRFWVPGGTQKPERTVALEEVLLIPDQKNVRPGDTLGVLVQAPFTPARGVMTIRRDGLVRTESFVMDTASYQLNIPITEAHYPNFVVQVDLVGAAIRTNDEGKPLPDVSKRPAYAAGSLTIKVPPLRRALDVVVRPRDKALNPGGKTQLHIAVTDSNGKGVSNAEMAVVVVDESVLSLTGYQMADPVDIFYSSRGAGVRDVRFRGMVHLTDPESLTSEEVPTESSEIDDEFGEEDIMDAPVEMAVGVGSSGALADEPSPSPSPSAARNKPSKAPKSFANKGKGKENKPKPGPAIQVRNDFNALAHFAPIVRTNTQGEATVDIQLPDNLTRYRVMVVAVSGEKMFGKGESTITARLPIMLRPSPPRFLNFGDVFELPLVVQNQTDKDAEVLLAARATNMGFVSDLSLGGPGNKSEGEIGVRVQVPANDRVEIRFPATTIKAGKAKFQAVFSSGKYTDAASFEIPIWTPATSEGFAAYGEIDEGVAVQSLLAPEDVWPQFGGLQVSTSSTQLQALTDAVLYLSRYPYECNEQRGSRVLAIAALNKVLSEFEVEGLPSPEALRSGVDADLEALRLRQNSDGGWAFWRRGDASWPYLTIHVTHALVRAKGMKFDVPAGVLDRAMRYLKNIERYIPSWYSQKSRDAIVAYALSVRTVGGDVDGAKALQLARKGTDALSIETMGWILPTLFQSDHRVDVEKIKRFLMNRVSETAGNAHFITNYEDGAHVLLHSNRRVDGILLDALIQVDPKNDLIPKLVRGLLAHRVKGRWSSTQENAFVLLAMDRYFKEFEGVTPNFVARVWLGEGFAGEHTFRGRSTETAQIDIPMSVVAELKDKTQLVVQKDGVGRLYYRLGLTYAPKSLSLKPMDRGFAVLRTYEAIDDAQDVTQDDEGTWHIKSGASVRVRVQMVATGRRYHVALVDPLPAGLEVMNPALSVTGSIPQDPKAMSKNRYWWWSRPWYQHQNMRDERVEAFSTSVWSGVHEYTYVARATTPGRFVVPPAKAEEMYSPETFGRSSTDKVIVH